ncbi:dicarboxylate transporter 1, chloroplastic [Trifolium repens]|nr:dicarboxylate transporter 1, chloroplastic [Trifolium repens]
MRPYLFKYPAIAMRAANHVSVSHATPSAKHSFHVTTPVMRSMANPRMAEVTASTLRTPPKTQSPTW